MKQVPGWTYTFIDSLNQHIAINAETNIMYTEDKIRYSPQETDLLKKIEYKLPLQVHIVKKIFQGTIIQL